MTATMLILTCWYAMSCRIRDSHEKMILPPCSTKMISPSAEWPPLPFCRARFAPLWGYLAHPQYWPQNRVEFALIGCLSPRTPKKPRLRGKLAQTKSQSADRIPALISN